MSLRFTAYRIILRCAHIMYKVRFGNISFEYINGNQKIYGRFSIRSDSEMNSVTLSIMG